MGAEGTSAVASPAAGIAAHTPNEPIAKRASRLLVGEMTARALGFALYAVLARTLGVGGFGVVSLGMSVALMAGTFVDFGQSAHAVRVVSRDASLLGPTIWTLVRSKSVLGVLVLAAVPVGMYVAGFSAAEVSVAAAMTGWAVVLSVFESDRALLRATGQPGVDAAWNAGESLLRLCLVVVAGIVTGTAIGVAWAFVLEASLAAAALTYLLLRGRGVSSVVPLSSRAFLTASVPIGLSAIALAAFYRSDQIILTALAGADANGVYAAAARLAFTANVVAQLVVAAAFPELSACAHDRETFLRTLRRAVVLAGGASIAVSMVLALLAGPLVAVVYGAGFEGAVALTRILAITVAFNGLTSLSLYAGIAMGSERVSLALVLGLTPLTILGYVVAIRFAGATGAAWVSVAGEMCLCAALFASLLIRVRKARVAS